MTRQSFLSKYATIGLFCLVMGGLLTGEFAYAKRTLDSAPAALGTFVDKTGVDKIDFNTAAGNVVNRIFYAVGFLFFVLVVKAGINWMTARGDEEAVKKARETIIAAVIGLIIVVASYAITNLVTQRILLQKNAQVPAADTTQTSPDSQGNEVLGCCVLDYSGDSPHKTVQILNSTDCQNQQSQCSGINNCHWNFWAGEDYVQCQKHL